MIILIMGAPGAGKGTQADIISQILSVPKISTGDIFRKNIAEKTILGKEALKYIQNGLLVPDEITISIAASRIKEPDCKDGFILDGFPRTIAQAKELDNILNGIGKKIDLVLNLEVDDECIVKRLGGRRVCAECGNTYHIDSKPSIIAGICDSCKSELVIREDDEEQTILKRLTTYHNQTEALIEYYNNQGNIVGVDGSKSAADTAKEIKDIIGDLSRKI